MSFRLILSSAVVAIALVFTAAPHANAQSLTDGAKKILEEALKDKGAAKQACAGGVEGVTKYVTDLTIKMVQGGTSGLDPFKDGQAAGQALGGQCVKLMGG